MTDSLSNYNAESSVLGSILQQPDLLSDCYLQKEEFGDPKHRLIMEYMRYLDDIEKPIDPVVMAQHAGKGIEKVGGISYLMQLRDSVPSLANFTDYQNIVRKLYIRRRTVETLEKMAGAGASQENDADVREFIGGVQTALDEIAAIQEDSDDVMKMSDVLRGHEKKLTQRRNQMGMTGAKTASEELDQLTGGHQEEDLEIIAARPSMGKTAYIVNDMVETTRGGRAAVLFSLEMSAEKIAERAVCAISNLDSTRLRTGQLQDNDWEKWSFAIHELERLPLLIADTPGLTLRQMEAKIKRLKKQYPRLVVYLDFLQLLNPGRKFTQEREGVAYVSKGLKQIARKYKIPVIAISAVGRDCEKRQDKRPMMSDLRESGSIESDADIVVFLYRDEYYNPKTTDKPGVVELILAKGRNVGIGTVEMLFNKKTGKFLNKPPAKKEAGSHERKADSKRSRL